MFCLCKFRYLTYILKFVSESPTRKEIVEEFDCDEQLVSIWTNYPTGRKYLNNISVVTNEDHAFLRNFTDSATGKIAI
jgi:hypothetical protein